MPRHRAQHTNEHTQVFATRGEASFYREVTILRNEADEEFERKFGCHCETAIPTACGLLSRLNRAMPPIIGSFLVAVLPTVRIHRN